MLNSHIVKNIISKFFGLGVNLINQIALIPLFITFWGVEKYGDWIIISTIMSFFSMSNVGFNDVMANKFIVAHTENKEALCRKYLTNNYILLIFASIVCLLGLSIFVSFFDIEKLFSTKVTSGKELVFVIYFLFFQIITAQFSSVLNAVYRSVKKTYIAFYLEDGVKVIELIIMLICIYYNFSFVLLSFLLVIPKVVLWGYKILNIPKYFNYYFTLRDFDFKILKNAALPSVSFMAFPAGYAIMNQGFTLVVAKNYSAEILILFSTTRTLCNFIRTFIGIFQVSIWPEYSIAYGNKDISKMQKIHRNSIYITVALTSIIGLGLLVFGPLIYNIWTNNQITFNFDLMLVFLCSILVGNLWYSSSVVQMATNKHQSISLFFLFFSMLSLFVSHLVINFNDSIIYIVLCLLVLDLPLSIITLTQSLKLTNDSFYKLVFNIKI
ncbi:hypothetical protein [Chryseobacterium sp. Leaf394]|uniref:lipopolysaccharide biosynthesis protein n=1 Tax=Chryseobacterium sp. Leaf394 TaxID=1736361 RepID=UPI0006F8426E|nr:hypothetical protein [Chryseobacterium sp. Leaf394]KQS93230.1 hypothetical protein ASG21_12660 [Chryseobacterium sp. Leaf394]